MAKSDFNRFGLPGGPGRGSAVRAAILKHLADMRSGRAPPATKMDFAGHLLTIPELDYYVLLERFPDLKSLDAEIKRRAWLKFAQSDASLAYRSTARKLRSKLPIIGLE